MDQLIEFDVFRNNYKRPTKGNIGDIELACAIIYELHTIKEGESLQEEEIIDRIQSKYNIAYEKIANVIYILCLNSMACKSRIFMEKEPAYEKNKFSFGLRKTDAHHKTPWILNHNAQS